MFTVILILWGSIALGYLTRRHPLKNIGTITTWMVWVLLFFMGWEIGSNPGLVNAIGRIGIEASILTFFSSAGCMLFSYLWWKHINSPTSQTIRKPSSTDINADSSHRISTFKQMKGSLIILGFFFAGCFTGYFSLLPSFPPQTSFYILCGLLVCVGIGIGQSDNMKDSLRRLDKRLFIMPLITIFGTWLGALLTALLLPQYSLTDWLAVSSGFGYYSLSSILITEIKGAELGTIALIYNILRELIVLTGAPFLRRYFGPLAPISQGGATTGDTTLPIISSSCGHEFVPLSVYHGFTIDFTVPFLVPFFCSF